MEGTFFFAVVGFCYDLERIFLKTSVGSEIFSLCMNFANYEFQAVSREVDKFGLLGLKFKLIIPLCRADLGFSYIDFTSARTSFLASVAPQWSTLYQNFTEN